ncbi:uncharacterized protein TNCT_185191 [Trichonephila clavata]|uniref:Uncharacterized protein n=1 Tax=Trichonephila clavata TaxID=2740835 RepID=A0A8X6KFM2_TRICU|nr:uncharacterized protein TNCT_185191 [Trichonephila clavata]
MEIMPSKFRSPPPKPPRRRHSDQLTIPPSGTYPSSRKKYHEETKLCLKETQSKSLNHAGCGSLPANWTPDFSPDNKFDNSVQFKSASQGSSALLRNPFVNIKMPISSILDRDGNGLSDEMMDADLKNENFDWTRKKELPFLEQVVKSSMFSKLKSRDFFGCFQNDHGIECSLDEMPSNSFKQKSFHREYHRRHHSDPLLTYLDRSNSKNGSQKYVHKTSSFFESLPFDNQNRLCNSLDTSFEHKETLNLHEEIKTLKDINNKLWQQLCSTQVCLEKMKNSEENTGSLSISDLLTSLYCSQRAKDSAMEDRMRIVLEERDAAIQELEDMVQIIARSFKDDALAEERLCSDKEIKDLLKEIEITYNPAKLLQQQRLLLTYLYRSKELKQDRIMHELKLSISEKNHLREKMEYLEEEIKSMRICNELWNSDNKHWENNLLNILCQVIQQRDIALSKVNNVQSIEHTKYRSANENPRIAEPLTDDYESYKKHEDDSISVAKRSFQSSHHDIRKSDQFSLEPSSDEIRLLKGEILVLNKALEMEIEKRENAEEKCLRLERLVNVLQRKVNGQNVGISV